MKKILLMAVLLTLLAAPLVQSVAAQEEANTDSAMDTEGTTVEVIGVEYAFQGLPTSLPADTELGFTNAGAEVHDVGLTGQGHVQHVFLGEDVLGAADVAVADIVDVDQHDIR